MDCTTEGPGPGTAEFAALPPGLPDGGAVPISEKAPPSCPSAGQPRRVVVADDDRDSADSLAVLLRLNGHEVWTAYDGQEAVDVAAQSSPDVVLLDIGMPRLNGYQAAMQLRARLARRVHLVALTGWGEEGDRQEAARAGFDHYLTKPVDLDRLVALLASLQTRRDDGPGDAA
jgi:CheY-like chemotaxis protein